MKKILFVGLAVFSLVACRSDDDNSSEASIVGTWKRTKTVVYDGKTNAVLSTEDDDCQKKSTLIFVEDGTYTFNDYFEEAGNCTNDGIAKGTYTYANKVLKVDNDEEYAVETLTSKELVMSIVLEDENGDGTLDKTVIYLTK